MRNALRIPLMVSLGMTIALPLVAQERVAQEGVAQEHVAAQNQKAAPQNGKTKKKAKPAPYVLELLPARNKASAKADGSRRRRSRKERQAALTEQLAGPAGRRLSERLIRVNGVESAKVEARKRRIVLATKRGTLLSEAALQRAVSESGIRAGALRAPRWAMTRVWEVLAKGPS